MEILYKKKDSQRFFKYWKSYLDSYLSSYKYLLLNIDYFLLYSKYLIDDKSFVVLENQKCVGICFLPIEEINDIRSISISNGYVFSPLSISNRIEKIIFREIDIISSRLNVQKINFAIDPLILEYKEKFNNLLKYGYIDTSTSDCLVDLKVPKAELWKNLQKSYKSLINKVLKDNAFDIVIIDASNPEYITHEKYRELHHKCAGMVTRNKKTFDKQFEMLENDCASLIGLKYNDEFIGFNYFFHFQKTVIYASGSDDPEYEKSKIPIYHVILWNAIKYYKRRNFEFIQFSQPCGYSKVQGFNDYLDKKQLNISHFKRGMGAKMVTSYRGIKYINKDLLLEDIELFKKFGEDEYE
ncbi:hypothetical protein CRV02_02500 [Arcobacter sp. CECT 8989]|uniref:hypothetical protein n=1 Tax=Arcobacter sp. CECT 8989 TaxID=2044509 RepID=UPI00100B81CC|nr:hypothetical protein [Arcobacter sp. CECT 8989]RXK03012.1 hypothetical protein CRV02_02500 [Arcobacter sp. CECT 8989]